MDLAAVADSILYLQLHLRSVGVARPGLLKIIKDPGKMGWVRLDEPRTDHCRFSTVDLTGDPNAVPECPALLQQYWGNVMVARLRKGPNGHGLFDSKPLTYVEMTMSTSDNTSMPEFYN